MARLTLSDQVAQLTKELAEKSTQCLEYSNRAAQLESAVQAHMNNMRDFRALENLHDKLNEKYAALEKELATQKSSNTYTLEARNRCEAELEQAHAVLDGVEGAPAREYPGEYGSTKQRNVVTRLAGAFLSIARGASVTPKV